MVYLFSLRNAAADLAGQQVPYKGELRYMPSPLEYLVEQLNHTDLGAKWSLEAIIYDDDPESPRDRDKLGRFGFKPQADGLWIYPQNLSVQGVPLNNLLEPIPSTYRKLPLAHPGRTQGKQAFERRLKARLDDIGADLVLLDGLLVILDELVRPGAPYRGRIVNIHPGITRLDSPYERRGATATLDALWCARGQKVTNWTTMQAQPTPPLFKTGASFHLVDNGIDSGEVIVDSLNTDIHPDDTILELRWNNFHHSLFPTMRDGLYQMHELLCEVEG
nr:formyltransferase family protein [Chitinivorax tropicus]